MTREQVLDAAVRSVRLARSLCADVEISCEAATRTETDFLLEVCKAAVEAGATTINIPDPVGYATVDEYGGLIDAICREVAGERDIVISTHCHNDLGLATATTLEAIRRGEIEDWELEGARRALISGHQSTLDDQGRLEEFWLGQAAAGLDTGVEELAERFASITREQVAAAAQRLELDTVYFLNGQED